MKKSNLFLMAVAILMVLSSCSKKDSLKYKSNYWVQKFAAAETFVGQNLTDVAAELKNEGFKTSNNYEFTKRDASQNLFGYQIEASANGKVAYVTYYVAGYYNTLDDDITDTKAFSNFLKYLGKSYSSKYIGDKYDFYGGMYLCTDGSDGDLDEKNFSDIFNVIGSTDLVTLSWMDPEHGIIYVNRYDNGYIDEYPFLMQFDIHTSGVVE